MKRYSRRTKGSEVQFVVTEGMDEETIVRLAAELGWTCEFIAADEYMAELPPVGI